MNKLFTRTTGRLYFWIQLNLDTRDLVFYFVSAILITITIVGRTYVYPQERVETMRTYAQVAQSKERNLSLESTKLAPNEIEVKRHIYEELGDSKHVFEDVSRLQAEAMKLNIAIEEINYSYEELDRNEQLQKVKLTLPLKSTYKNIKKLVLNFLNSVPYSALETLELSRDNGNDNTVSGRIVFSLYLSNKNGTISSN